MFDILKNALRDESSEVRVAVVDCMKRTSRVATTRGEKIYSAVKNPCTDEGNHVLGKAVKHWIMCQEGENRW